MPTVLCRISLAATILLALVCAGTVGINAEVENQVPPGVNEINWNTPWAPPGFTGTPAFIDFEGLQEQTILGELIPGIRFTTTDGQDWLVARMDSGNYNGKYPNGQYTCQRNACTWLGMSQGSGIIRFTEGKASFFSCLTSTYSGIVIEAYDENDNLIVSSGWAADNTETGTMDRVTVVSANQDIQYVVVHDSGNYWLIDCISSDAPGIEFRHEHPVGIGGEVAPAGKAGVMYPWLAAALVLTASGIILSLQCRRR